MRKLRNKNLGVSGGFVYVQKESGMKFSCSSWDQLIVKLKNHRTANNYDIPINWEAEVEDQVCENCGAEQWCYEDKHPEAAPKTLGLGDVVMFTRVLVDKFVSGGKNVEAEEATRRAAICVSCPDNVSIGGCKGCNSGRVETAVRRITNSGATKHDNELETCRWCGCFNRAQIWFPLQILQKNMSDDVKESLPKHCWKK